MLEFVVDNCCYALTADRLCRLLERFGLSMSCLSQSGTLSLKTLADVSLTLGVQQASDSEYVFHVIYSNVLYTTHVKC